MRWWCSATGAPWTWTWRPYPGVWLFALLPLAAYVAARRICLRHHPDRAWPARRVATFAAGVAVAWLANDWPLGALGAGYLVSVHTVQYLLLALIAPILLWLGLPPWVAGVSPRPRIARALRGLAHPVPALLAFNAILLVTHVPAVVDRLMTSQWGSFAIDLSWLVGGLWLWWPVVAPAPIGRLPPPAQIGYVFATTILPTAPAAFLTFADYPVYALYELAPRVGVAARSDQQIAGLLMKFGADAIIWVVLAVIFFRWQAEERTADGAPTG